MFLYCSRIIAKTLGERNARRPVSRVLSLPRGRGWPILCDARCRAPRATVPYGGVETRVARRPATPTWSCSRWGLPCRRRRRRRGALLPHHFTLAAGAEAPVWRCVSVALSLGLPPPGVTRHRVSREPGLSSLRRSGERPSGRLAPQDKGSEVGEVKPWATMAMRARVSRSGSPSQRAGRKWRWKAAMTCVVSASFSPFCGIS